MVVPFMFSLTINELFLYNDAAELPGWYNLMLWAQIF